MVHPCYIGGDFGGKGDFMDVAVAYVLSRKSGRPVKMVMDYDEELMAGNPRHACAIKVRTGVKRDGRIMAHHLDFVFDSGAYGAFKPIGFLFGAQEAGGAYRMPHHLSEERVVYTNKIPCGHMRAPGDPQGFFATESQMDAVAEGAGHGPGGVPQDQPDARRRRVAHRPRAAPHQGRGDPGPGPRRVRLPRPPRAPTPGVGWRWPNGCRWEASATRS